MLLRFAVIAVGRILEGEEQIKSDDCFDSNDKTEYRDAKLTS